MSDIRRRPSLPPVPAEYFRGVSAFPLTPLIDGGAGGIDEGALAALVARAAAAGVASIAVLGSTGSYMYLTARERARAIEIAVAHSGGVPILAGVGSIATREVLANVRAAEAAGVHGVIVAPVSYQRLNDDEVYELYREVCEAARVPVVVYDNPGTTGVTFSLELYARVAALPGIASIKIPPPPGNIEAVRAQVAAIRTVIPAHVTIGISGDAAAAVGLAAGCDAWYSVIAGVLPETALRLASEAVVTRRDAMPDQRRTGLPGLDQRATPATAALAQITQLFGELGGSLRVAAALAEELGLVAPDCLPRPVLGLPKGGRRLVREALERARPELDELRQAG